MKIPLSWISLYCDVNTLLATKWAKELGHLYSIHTAEIEAIEQIWEEEKVVVGQVLSTRPHPDSDHLNLVEVDLGAHGRKPIVCGAANVVGAKYVPVAMVGSRLGPARDFEIRSSKIRGEVSEGMICSQDELGLQEDRAPGIMRLEDYFDETLLSSKLGTPFFSLPLAIPGFDGNRYEFPIRDTVFEIDNKFITNRPDLFAVAGNAREFGAIFSLPFRAHAGSKIVTAKTVPARIESKHVLSYSLLAFDGVGVGPSPLGIEQMLRKSGLSVKYDLVDITNFIMTELGQPMHAFDADKVEGGIIVREARDGEKLLALDGKEYTLTARDVVIADEQKVLAIAGVIGGVGSAVSDTTKNAIFESAVFDPVAIRLTSQRLAIRTDASMRYEKSLDPLMSERALSRVVELLAFLGKQSAPSASFHYLDTSRVNDISISTDTAFISRKLGIDISRADTENILNRLGFEVTFYWTPENLWFSGSPEKWWNSRERWAPERVVAGATVSEEAESWTWSSRFAEIPFTARVPSWRATKDVSIREDIAEEVGRIHGYERIENTPIHGPFSIATPNKTIELRDRTNAYFSSQGWYETYNYSFSGQSKDAKIGLESDADAVHIQNAFNIEYTQMRRSMIPNLLEVAAENLKQSKSFGFFEIGRVFHKSGENDFKETRAIAGVRCAGEIGELREVLDGFVRSILPGRELIVRQGTHRAYLHPNKSGIYELDGCALITFGSVHPATAESFGLSDASAYAFEIDYPLLAESFSAARYTFREIAKYPGVRRELNFVMDDRMPTAEVIERIASVHSFLSDFSVVDIFRDDTKVGAGKKSVTFSFLIQDSEKTITDEEALVIQDTIISRLSKEGMELRR